jgi:hypothetical protein
MQYSKQLSLTKTPLKGDFAEELCYLKNISEEPNGLSGVNYQTLHYNIEKYLHEDLLNSLDSINLKPFFFIHFGAPNQKEFSTILHSDLYKENAQWVPMPVGIAWELTPGTTNFKWYDTSAIKEVPPTKELPFKPADFNSNHYIRRFSKDTTDCILLENLIMERNTPYLVRSDIPHQVDYTCTVPTRISINLRFQIKDIPTWEKALEVFKPLII